MYVHVCVCVCLEELMKAVALSLAPSCHVGLLD